MRSAIAEIRDRVAQLRAALLTPGVHAVNECIPILEEAAGRLREISSAPLDPQDGAEVSLLKQDLARVQVMAATGLALWQGWARLIDTASGSGYTASGGQTGPAARSGVEVQG